MDVASIRIDSPLLNSHQGKVVRVLGKCDSFDPSSASAILSSNGPIHLILNPGETLAVNKNYEVIGKVGTNDPSVSVYSVIELSDNLNLDAASKLVHFVHKVPELFHK